MADDWNLEVKTLLIECFVRKSVEVVACMRDYSFYVLDLCEIITFEKIGRYTRLIKIIIFLKFHMILDFIL